jgi:S1-C subfamily serine protease
MGSVRIRLNAPNSKKKKGTYAVKKILSFVMSVALSVSLVYGVKWHQEVTQASEFQRLRQASARIDIVNEFGKMGSCSGTFIDRHIMLSAAHCNPGMDGIKLMVGNKEAHVIKQDVLNDLLLLLVNDESTPVNIGFGDLPPETEVVVVGYPFGISQYLTHGTVQEQAQIPEDVRIMEVMPDHFLTFYAPISPGNSGGGIFTKDKHGEYVLVGVVSRGGGSVGLGVPPDIIVGFLR